MKVLKIIGIIILVVIVIGVIGMFVTPTEMEYEKSVSINAPIEVVWEQVNSVDDINSWSPWMEKDPDMKQEVSGEPGTIGETHSWESDNPDVGSGSSTISKLEPPTLVVTDLKFTDPYESEAKAFVKLEKEGEGTKATWGFSSEMPRPMNLFMIGMDMEEMIGADYENGLNKLKGLSEQAKADMEKQMIMDAMVEDSVSMD